MRVPDHVGDELADDEQHVVQHVRVQKVAKVAVHLLAAFSRREWRVRQTHVETGGPRTRRRRRG